MVKKSSVIALRSKAKAKVKKQLHILTLTMKDFIAANAFSWMQMKKTFIQDFPTASQGVIKKARQHCNDAKKGKAGKESLDRLALVEQEKSHSRLQLTSVGILKDRVLQLEELVRIQQAALDTKDQQIQNLLNMQKVPQYSFGQEQLLESCLKPISAFGFRRDSMDLLLQDAHFRDLSNDIGALASMFD